MKVYVATSDNYLPALRVYAHLFNKYWGEEQQVVVAGYTPPDYKLPRNFTFYSIGKFEDYPITKWSDGYIKFLKDMDDEIFTFMLEDYWLARDVDVRGVSILVDYMRQFEYVARIDLTSDRLFSDGPRYPDDIPNYGNVSYLDLVRSRAGSQYHLSLMAGLWRRETILELLHPGETPWQIELEGTTRLSEMGDDKVVLGTRQCPIKHILAHRGGDPRTLGPEVAKMPKSDLRDLAEKGYIKWGE